VDLAGKENARRFSVPAGMVFLAGNSMAETDGDYAIIFAKFVLILKIVTNFFS
jgi:hypothetical protein